jgi:hypothetical protein
MRIGLLLLVLMLCIQLNAQQDYWDEGLKQKKEFYKILEDVKSGNKPVGSLLKQFKKADEYFKYALSMSIEYKNPYAYNMAMMNYEFANYYVSKADYVNANLYLTKVFEYWPNFSFLSNLNYSMIGSFGQEVIDNYAAILQLAMQVADFEKDNQKILGLELKYKELKIVEKSYFINLYLFRAHLRLNNEEEAFRYGSLVMQSIEKLMASDNILSKPEPNTVLQWLREAKNVNVNEVFNLAILFERNKQFSDASLFYGKYLDLNGKNTLLNVAFNIANYAVSINDKNLLKKVLLVIESMDKKDHQEFELRKIAEYYSILDDNVGEKEYILKANKLAKEKAAFVRKYNRKIKAKDFRQSISLSVSTNPIMFLYKDNIWVFNLRTGNVMHEYRRAQIYNPNDKNRFGTWLHESGAFDYKGLEQSYTMKFLLNEDGFEDVNRRNTYSGKYLGFQYRWAGYKPSENFIMVNNPNGYFEKAIDFDAEMKRKEGVIILGYLIDNKKGWFHMDVYCGLGIGYRQLIVNSDIEGVNWENTYDKRYNPENWNKFYGAARLGFRIGINIL